MKLTEWNIGWGILLAVGLGLCVVQWRCGQ